MVQSKPAQKNNTSMYLLPTVLLIFIHIDLNLVGNITNDVIDNFTDDFIYDPSHYTFIFGIKNCKLQFVTLLRHFHDD